LISVRASRILSLWVSALASWLTGVVPLGAADPPHTVDAELQALMDDGKYADAEAAAQAALERLEAQYGPESVELVEVLDVLLESRWRGGKARDPETRALGERGLEIKRRGLGSEHASVGKSLHHLAIVAFFNRDLDAARENFEQAIDIRQRALGPDHPDVAESLNGLANVLKTVGDFDGAARMYERAVRAQEQAFGPMDQQVGKTLNNLALLLKNLGDYAEALPVAERSLEIKRASFAADHPQVGVGMVSLADLLLKTGDLERAREQVEGALKILEKAHGADHPEVATVVNNLGEMRLLAEEYAEALPLFERALAIREKVDGPEDPSVAVVLNNLGMLLEATGDYGRASEVLERSVRIREVALGADHPLLANSLNNLAGLLMRTGELERAREAFDRSVEIRRTAFGPDHPFVAESLGGLAGAYALGGKSQAAFELALEAESIGRDHLRLTSRALAEEHALRYAEARSGGIDLALTMIAEHPRELATREVLDTLVRSRAVVLDEMAARGRSIVASGDPEIEELARQLTHARARVANLTVRGPGGLKAEEYRRVLDEAKETKEKAERALGGASAEFARQQQRNALGSDDVVDGLPEETALVAFALYDRATLAFDEETEEGGTRRLGDPVPSYLAVVQRAGDSAPIAVPLGSAAEIDASIARWKREAATGARNIRRSPEESEEVYREVADDLREKVWTPVAAHLGDAKRVFLVPDGQLNLVSFAALPVGADRYLIDTGPVVHYLSAERDLVALETADAGAGLFAVGGPDYDTTELFGALRSEATTPALSATAVAVELAAPRTRSGTRGSFQSLRFDPLPAAVNETAEVVSMWRETVEGPGSAVLHLTGVEASESAFKSRAAGHRILHVATHGFFLGATSEGGAGTRGLTVKETEAPEPLPTRVSPLLLSGLAMAGANHRDAAVAGEEDGILTAEEMAALDLSGVEWAVLSACDTGVGEIQAGEGVFGLRRALQLAGVGTLIMSLWPVDDEATMEWMTGLYRGRLELALDSASAVRSAGLGVLEHRRAQGESTHPFYWAAFIAAGDWR
jgi:CHAT domain-containing protein/Tfp pilus assembly protein PilF